MLVIVMELMKTMMMMGVETGRVKLETTLRMKTILETIVGPMDMNI